jgi:glycosyltransferase involved in cell wall biosynthesis
LEIIIIDDRSTDATGKIIDSYAADDRCKIVHQENAGIAETRNRALSMCSGDYIGWVDADDYVELNMFEKMVNVMESENCDICICNYTYERNNHVLEKNVALNEGATRRI